LVYLELTAFTV